VLVTGANGFVGSHLVEALLARGYGCGAWCAGLAIWPSFSTCRWSGLAPICATATGYGRRLRGPRRCVTVRR